MVRVFVGDCFGRIEPARHDASVCVLFQPRAIGHYCERLVG